MQEAESVKKKEETGWAEANKKGKDSGVESHAFYSSTWEPESSDLHSWL